MSKTRAASALKTILLRALGQAPRDKAGRVPLHKLPRTQIEDLLNTPDGLPNILYRGEPGRQTTEGPTWFTQNPRHALWYAAQQGDYPGKGYLSVFEAPWKEMPLLNDDIFEKAYALPQKLDFNKRIMMSIPEDVALNNFGARFNNIDDFAFDRRALSDELWGTTDELLVPQSFIWNKDKLIQRKKGGLARMSNGT